MTSDEILNTIDFIGGETSKNLKIDYLAEFIAEDEEFERVLKAAYDPYVRYYLKTVEMQDGGIGIFSSEGVWDLLDKLSKRLISGDAARDAVWKLNLNRESVELFRRILQKDLKAGFDIKSINRSLKKAERPLLPVVGYMRCSLPKAVKLEEWPWEEGVYSQIKADGTFCNIRKTGLQTR